MAIMHGMEREEGSLEASARSGRKREKLLGFSIVLK
jgi:hypothetical protein